jgi:hypothetical protein
MQPGARNIYHEAIGELQVTRGILHGSVSEFMYFTNLISYSFMPPPIFHYLEINSSLAIYQRMTLAVGPSLQANALPVFLLFLSSMDEGAGVFLHDMARRKRLAGQGEGSSAT